MSINKEFNKLIFLSCNFYNTGLFDFENTILIHNMDKLKSVQKQFYKKVIKNNVDVPSIKDWDEFKEIIGSHDIKIIIIQENQLKYN